MSDSNGHNGKLRCIVKEKESGAYDFHFWARWQVFAGTYHVEPSVERGAKGFTFTGTKNLGRLAGGSYRFEGAIVGDQFDARYESRIDHGRFELTRRSE